MGGRVSGREGEWKVGLLPCHSQLCYRSIAGVVPDILIVPVSIGYDKVRCGWYEVMHTLIPYLCYFILSLLFMCYSYWRKATFDMN